MYRTIIDGRAQLIHLPQRTAVEISTVVVTVYYLALLIWLDLEMARLMETLISMAVVTVDYSALLIWRAIVKAVDRITKNMIILNVLDMISSCTLFISHRNTHHIRRLHRYRWLLTWFT